jgi:hypothetical protein
MYNKEKLYIQEYNLCASIKEGDIYNSMYTLFGYMRFANVRVVLKLFAFI